jgi:hypothetical protein
MNAIKGRRKAAGLVLGLLFLASNTAMGQKAPPQTYPEQATVISSNTLQAEDVNVSSVDAYSTTEAVGDNSSVDAILHTAYRVQTKTATYEITGWEAVRKANKSPELRSGDVIHFRVQGNHVFLVLPDGKEHRYTLVSKHPTDSSKESQLQTRK